MGWVKRVFGLEAPERRGESFEQMQAREHGIWNEVWNDNSVRTEGNLFGRSGHNSLRLSVVYACVNLISSKIAQLPVKYWKVDTKTGETIEPMELPPWVRNPDPAYGVLGLGWNDLITQAVTSLLLSGNAFLAYSTSRPGVVREVKVLNPGLVVIETTKDDKLILKVDGRVPPYAVIPIRYLVPPGDYLGVSPIKACQRSLTVAEGAQEQTATFFTQGSTIPGQIVFQGETSEEEMKRVLNRWNMRKAGVGKSHLPLALQNAEYKPMSVSPEDAQALETWRWADARVAAQIFGVDPSWLAIPSHSDNQTYSNIAARHRAFYGNTLLPIVRRLEQAFTWLCPKNGSCVLRFDNSEFVQDDARTRHHIYVNAIKNGYMTVNEVRAMEGLPPLPDEPEEEPTDDDEDDEPDTFSGND